MIEKFKVWMLILYWSPELIRTMWLHIRGRYYIFRDSPDEFLKFLAWIDSDGTEADAEDEDMGDYYRRAGDERQRRHARRGAQ